MGFQGGAPNVVFRMELLVGFQHGAPNEISGCSS